ncbi:MAG: LytTR family DNA-binding domain-containing protein [Cyclobacteriaceae bacterium]
MKLKCLIVEDEPLARNLLSDYVKKVSYLELVEASSNPLRALEVLRNNQVDLMFLDIQMPEITGITLLKTLQKKPLVILTTAYSEYALESYDLDVVDYLLKPITFDRFLKAVDKASQRINPPAVAQDQVAPEPGSPFVFIKDGTKLVKINYDDILFVEGLKDYVTIVTKTQKIVSLQRLKVLETQLPADKFLRIHHSYIIAIKAVDTIHKGEVQIGTHFIPISDSYKKAFKEFIERNQMQ